jgi:hypothetical protein
MFGKGIRPSGRFTEPAIMVHAPFTDGVIFLGLTLQMTLQRPFMENARFSQPFNNS